ncbi:MAG TPA: energy transducer TonB [Trichormus sp. M33_DOE_039]|nr:energy transducer TonB [Trichormus sp. M33_DOE_039]
MTSSGIAVEQRSKETEALRSFLVYSLIGSVALHIGVLAIGIGNLLQRTSEFDTEPLEVTIVEPPTVEAEPTPQEITEPKAEPETPSPPVRADVSNPREVATPQAITPVAIAPLKLKTEPAPKFSSNLKTPQVQQPPEKTSETPEQPQSNTQPQRVLTSEPTNTQQTTTQAVEPSSDRLRGLLGNLRNTRAVQGNSNSNTVEESNNSASPGSNVGVNTGNTGDNGNVSNRRSRGNGTVATAPTGVKIEAPSGNNNPGNNSSRSGNGRAACRECGTSYPEAARRRGIEGKVKVAVDTDEKGNVTNVRIVNSSGNRDLDEETLRQARNWKLKPSATGRQGVAIDTEYAIAGSRRYRELQERKRQRQARQQSTPASTNTAENTSSGQQSTRASNNTETRTRRRRLSPNTPTSQPSTASTSNTRTSDNQRSVRNSLRRLRREPTATQSSPQSQPTATRRRRRIPTQEASSSSTNRLRNALRRSRQPSPSQPSSSTPTQNNNE